MTENQTISQTWGLPILKDMGYVRLFGFMLSYYSELGLTRQEMMCLIHLAHYHYESERGVSRPSLSTVAKEMGYSDRAPVSRLVASLEEKGMIAVTHRAGKPSIYNCHGFAEAAFNLWLRDHVAGHVPQDTTQPTEQTHVLQDIPTHVPQDMAPMSYRTREEENRRRRQENGTQTTTPNGVACSSNKPDAVKERLTKALERFQEQQDRNGVDPTFSKLPLYQGEILTEFYRCSGIPIPKTVRLLKEASAAAEVIYQELGSAERAAELIRRFFQRRSKGHPDMQFTVNTPWSVCNTIITMSAEKSTIRGLGLTLAELENAP